MADHHEETGIVPYSPESQGIIKRLLGYGSDMTGAGVGGVLGFLMGGAVGAAAGGTLGVCVSVVGRGLVEVGSRVLSPGEQRYIGVTAFCALAEIKRRLDAGESLREDGFFDGHDKPSTADEVFAATLHTARLQHERAKARHLGLLNAAFNFEHELSGATANAMLKVAGSLTYRQFCLIQVVMANAPNNSFGFREESYGERGAVSPDTLSAAHELFELCNLGLMVCHLGAKAPNDLLMIADVSHITPSNLRLSTNGIHYWKLLGLTTIPEEDLDESKVLLRG